MKLQLIANLHILACSGFGLFYGIAKVNVKKKPPTYFLFILFSVLSAFLSRIFYSLSIAFHGGLPDTFNIGFVGYAATFLFFLFANIGQMDWLVDDRKNVKPIYRIIPAVVPLFELTVAVFGLFIGKVKLAVRISYLVITIVAGFAEYFNIKHVIIPDVNFGIVKTVRGFNITAFFVSLLSLAEIGLSVFGFNDMIIYVQIVLGALYAAIIPILSSEVKKWTL